MPDDDDVQLDRRFLELKSGEEDDIAKDLPLFDLRDLVPWDSVLGERCAVILGEAGTGKTTEFRLRCKLLAESGLPAFFLAVEALAVERVSSLLGPEEEERLSAWASADTIAYFFLDAVDEARLRNKSLASALRNLERELRGNLGRSRVLISCRVSDWRAQRDHREIHSILLRGNAAHEVKVFALAPLVETQVVLLAKHYLVEEDVEAFMREVRQVGAHSYLERPGDVASLVGHWREHRTIGTYTQLIESNVVRKLRESDPERRPSLTPARAKLAAMALAGLATLQRKASFVLPDGELDPERAATSLDPHSVLTDLSSGEIVELLRLPLFDRATYGRVRIHHRSVSEYLTARWLWSLIQRGLDPSEVESLLFQQTPSGPAIPPELTQAAAWLAAESPFIRDRVMEVAPLALLEGGDPNSLPDDTRREVLHRLAAQYQGRERLFRRFDRVALRRLATSTLAQTINELLTAPERPVELLETLLRIVIEGNLEGCAGAATRIAVDPTQPAPVREDAIEAVTKVGAPANKEAVVRALLGEQDVDQQIGGAAVDLLFPSLLDVPRLLELLRRSAKPPPDETGSLARVLGSRVYERTPDADRARLLSGILDFVQDPAASQAHRWLLAPFARLVVAHASTSDDEVGRRSLGFLDEMARGLTFETWYDLSWGADELSALLRGRPDLRRFLFWEQAARPLSGGRGRPTRYYELPPGHAPLWRLSAEDLDWLERDALSREHIPERLLAFDSFMSVQVPDERAEEVRARSERLAASHPALRTRFERRANRSRYEHPDEARWARQQQVRENRQHRAHAANLAWLREHLEEIRSGESQEALIWLWHCAPSSDEEESKSIIRELTEALDAEIAQAAEEGWRRSWRTVECPLPHEKEERNVVSNTAMIGLAGISADLRQGLDLASLSADAATQAARLATHVMNRFPSWIEPLVRYHGPCVQAVFGTCIRADYAAPAQHDVLGLLAHAPQPVREVCAPVLGELIQAGDPADTRVLEQVLEALLSLPAQRTMLARMAPERCAGDMSNLVRFALWWAVWFAADPDAAVGRLATQLAADNDRAGERVLAVCERIWSWLERYKQAGFGLPEHAPALTSFLAIVLTYVHPSGDVRHVGAHYLGPRDHAEWLRGLLIQRLAAIPGQGTVDGLVQLANDPRWPEWRDWLLSLAERRRADDLTVAANDVAAKLLKAYQAHGLAAPEHLVEAGLRTVSITAVREHLDQLDDDAWIAFSRGILELQSGDATRAVAIFEQLVEAKPRAAAAQVNLFAARLRAAESVPEERLRRIEQALEAWRSAEPQLPLEQREQVSATATYNVLEALDALGLDDDFDQQLQALSLPLRQNRNIDELITRVLRRREEAERTSRERREAVLGPLSPSFVPDEVRRLRAVPGIDLMIFTALTEEGQVVEAVMAEVAMSKDAADDLTLYHVRCKDGRTAVVATTCAHHMGAVNMAVFAAPLLKDVLPRSATLVGIAAAVDTKDVGLGDVPFASEVLGYDDIAVESSTFYFRTSGYQVDPRMLRAAGALRLSRSTYQPWQDDCVRQIDRVVDEVNAVRRVPIQKPAVIERPYLQAGIVAGGPFLLRDRNFRDALRRHPKEQELAGKIQVAGPVHPKLVSTEMESKGFMAAAHEAGVPATVIKGISDDGDEGKADLEKKTGGFYRVFACSNAVLAAVHVLAQVKA